MAATKRPNVSATATRSNGRDGAMRLDDNGGRAPNSVGEPT
jgi:hypothetical protein